MIEALYFNKRYKTKTNIRQIETETQKGHLYTSCHSDNSGNTNRIFYRLFFHNAFIAFHGDGVLLNGGSVTMILTPYI